MRLAVRHWLDLHHLTSQCSHLCQKNLLLWCQHIKTIADQIRWFPDIQILILPDQEIADTRMIRLPIACSRLFVGFRPFQKRSAILIRKKIIESGEKLPTVRKPPRLMNPCRSLRDSQQRLACIRRLDDRFPQHPFLNRCQQYGQISRLPGILRIKVNAFDQGSEWQNISRLPGGNLLIDLMCIEFIFKR